MEENENNILEPVIIDNSKEIHTEEKEQRSIQTNYAIWVMWCIVVILAVIGIVGILIAKKRKQDKREFKS